MNYFNNEFIVYKKSKRFIDFIRIFTYLNNDIITL